MTSEQITKEISDLERKHETSSAEVERLKIEHQTAILACIRGQLSGKKRDSIAEKLRAAQDEVNRLDLAIAEAKIQLQEAEVNERRAELEKQLAEVKALISGREEALERADASIASLELALREADQFAGKLKSVNGYNSPHGPFTKRKAHEHFSAVLYSWLPEPYRSSFNRVAFTALGRGKKQSLSLRELNHRVHEAIILGMEEAIKRCEVQN